MTAEKYLANLFRQRLRENRNLICVFIGPTGEGKSYSALRLAELMADRDPFLIFDSGSFLKTVQEEVKSNDVLVWDEAGLGMGARDWKSVLNKIAGYIIQSFRFKNLALFITVPVLKMIDIQGRQLSHWSIFCRYADRISHQVTALPYEMLTNPLTGEVTPIPPRFLDDGHVSRLRLVRFSMPSDGIVERYERDRKVFIDDYYTRLQRRIGQLESRESEVGEPQVSLVEKIKILGLTGRMKHREIAEDLGCSRPYVSQILKMKVGR